MAILTPVLTGGNGIPTYNLGMAETYSWIPIQNDQNRPMYARAGYITNLSDLTITLSTSNLNIGSVKLQDGVDGALASVVQAGTNYALLVTTQDLESTIDNITVGDINGNFAAVNSSLSALRIYNTNPVTSLSAFITNTQVEITNDLGNPLTVAGTVSATIINPVTISNQLTGIAVKNVVTNWDVLTANSTNGSFTTLPNNVASVITILNTIGETIFIKNSSKTLAFPLANNTATDIQLIGNTNEVAVKTSSLSAATIYGTFVAYN